MYNKDVIIVLGSGISDTGELHLKGVKRVEKAVEIYDRGVAPIILMSGGYSWHREDVPPITEAGAMKQLAVSLGVPEDAVLVEGRSRDTIGNLFFCKLQYLIPRGWTNLQIVTSEFHVLRSTYIAKRILGSTYVYDLEGVESCLSPEEHSQKIEIEKEKMKYLVEHYEDKFEDGDDDAIATMILDEHPGYRDVEEVRRWLDNLLSI